MGEGVFFNFVLPGIIATTSCFFVLLTYLLFPELRNMRYVELVFYVSLNDFLASIGAVMGDTTHNTGECWFQALTSQYNYISSIFWTTVITFQVWLVINKGHLLTKDDMIYMHYICWGLPLLLTILPFTTSTYGAADDDQPFCFFANTSRSPSWAELFWTIFSFYGWVLLAALVNAALLIHAFIVLRSKQIGVEIALQSLKKLAFYPIILIFCWTGLGSFVIYSEIHPLSGLSDSMQVFFFFASFISIMQGAFTPAVFFSTNPAIRLLWYNMICCRESKSETAISTDELNKGFDYVVEDQRLTMEIFADRVSSFAMRSSGGAPRSSIFDDSTNFDLNRDSENMELPLSRTSNPMIMD